MRTFKKDLWVVTIRQRVGRFRSLECLITRPDPLVAVLSCEGRDIPNIKKPASAGFFIACT